MSTEIKTVKGSCHVKIVGNTLKVIHQEAEAHLNRFYNGELGSCVQLTVAQSGEYGISYIHLNSEQCKELGEALLEAFDYEKYPSE